MLEELLGVLGNSHFEGYVASPLMGIVYGAILYGLTKKPDDAKRNESPEDVKNEFHIEKTEVHHHHHHHYGNRSSGPSEDGLPLALILGFVGIAGLFLLTAYLPAVAQVLHLFNATTAVFALTTVVLMVIGGRFNGPAWWVHSVFPVLASLICFWLTIEARGNVRPDVVTYAHSLIANVPWSFANLVSAVFTFFRVIGNQYVLWVELIGAAFVCIATCSVILLFQCIHYVSLSNLRAGGAGIWLWLALRTKRFGGVQSILLASSLLVVGGLLATGTVYSWIHPAVAGA